MGASRAILKQADPREDSAPLRALRAVTPDLDHGAPAATPLPAGSVECTAEEEDLRTAVADGLQDVSLTYWRTGVLDLDGLLQHVRRAMRHAYGVTHDNAPRDGFDGGRVEVLNQLCAEAERFWDDDRAPLHVGRILWAALAYPWASGMPAPSAAPPPPAPVPPELARPWPSWQSRQFSQPLDDEDAQAEAEARAEDPLHEQRGGFADRLSDIGYEFAASAELHDARWLLGQLAEVTIEVLGWSSAAPAPAAAPNPVPDGPPYDGNEDFEGEDAPETPASLRNIAQDNALTAFAMQWSTDPGGVDLPTFERVIATIREDWLQLRARAEA